MYVYICRYVYRFVYVSVHMVRYVCAHVHASLCMTAKGSEPLLHADCAGRPPTTRAQGMQKVSFGETLPAQIRMCSKSPVPEDPQTGIKPSRAVDVVFWAPTILYVGLRC